MEKKSARVRWTTAVPSREEQYSLKRRALVMEAGRAFNKKGYHNTSMEDVARVLNVTKPALYYYIKTKQEILFECHAYALELGEQARVAAWAASDKPLERLRLLLLTYIQLLTSSFGSHAALSEPISSLDPKFRNEIRSRLRNFSRIFEKLIDQAISDGSLPPCDAKMAIAFFMGAINNISRWFSPTGPIQGSDIAKIFVGFIMNGMLGQPPKDLVSAKPKPSAKAKSGKAKKASLRSRPAMVVTGTRLS